MADVIATPPRVNRVQLRPRRRGPRPGYRPTPVARLRMRVAARKRWAAIQHDRERARSLEVQVAQLLARAASNGGGANGFAAAKPIFLPFDELRQAWMAWCQQH